MIWDYVYARARTRVYAWVCITLILNNHLEIKIKSPNHLIVNIITLIWYFLQLYFFQDQKDENKN